MERILHRLEASVVLCLVEFSAHAASPTQVCEEAKELASISAQIPGYKLPSETDTPAKPTSKDKFNPVGILGAARGSHVCIAFVLDDSGAVQDAAAYYPKRLALSRSERNALLSQTFSPALVGGSPVKSIVYS